MGHTKKHMVEDYERLYQHAGLLELYLYDTQTGARPDAVEHARDAKHGVNARLQLWRAKGAAGGYVVIHESLSNVWLLDDAVKMYGESGATETTLAIRCALERLQVARGRILPCRECLRLKAKRRRAERC